MRSRSCLRRNCATTSSPKVKEDQVRSGQVTVTSNRKSVLPCMDCMCGGCCSPSLMSGTGICPNPPAESTETHNAYIHTYIILRESMNFSGRVAACGWEADTHRERSAADRRTSSSAPRRSGRAPRRSHPAGASPAHTHSVYHFRTFKMKSHSLSSKTRYK